MATRSPPRAGTGYIGLESWLANNGQQAAGIANNLAAGINSRAQAAETGLSGLEQEFNQGVDSQNYDFDDSGIWGPDGKLLPGSVPLARQRAADAAAYAEKGWGGPTTLEGMAGYDAIRAGATNAQRDANLTNDQYGRQSLLQDQYGKGGGYSFGAQRLDSALVGAAGGDTLNAAKSQWGGLLGKFDTASSNAKTRVEQAKQFNADALKKYQDTAARAAEQSKKQREAAVSAQKPQQIAESEDERRLARGANGGRPTGKKTGGNVDGWGDLWVP